MDYLASLLLLASTFFIGAVAGVTIKRSIHEAEVRVMENTIEKMIEELTKGCTENYVSDTFKIKIKGDEDAE